MSPTRSPSAKRRRGGRARTGRSGRHRIDRSASRRRRDVHGRFARRSRSTRPRNRRTVRRLPARDALGRFLPAGSFVETMMPPRPSVVREASRMSRPERRIVKRRWWRAEGPQNPELPKGYAFEDEI